MELERALMDDRWLSVDEVAEYLGVSKETVYTWVTAKGMPGYKVGRFWKFKRDDVDSWVRAGGAASASDPDVEGAARDE
jgi:excisionase family DNA binding protein